MRWAIGTLVLTAGLAVMTPLAQANGNRAPEPATAVPSPGSGATPAASMTTTPTPTPVTPAAVSAGADLAAAQRALGDLSAEFELQVARAGQGSAAFSASGKLWLASQRRYRVQYLRPERQLLVSNGKQRWLYLEAIRQVQVQTLPPAGDPNEFFLELGGGLANLITECTVDRLPASLEQPQRTGYQLVPLASSRLAFQRAEVWVEGPEAVPRYVVVEAARRVEVRLRPLKVHLARELVEHPEVGLTASWFEYAPPPGAEVIEMMWPATP